MKASELEAFQPNRIKESGESDLKRFKVESEVCLFLCKAINFQ